MKDRSRPSIRSYVWPMAHPVSPYETRNLVLRTTVTRRPATGSAEAQAERVAGRVEEDPEGLARLVLVLGRAEREHLRLGGVEVVDDHVEVHLLRHLLSRPLRRGIVRYLLEG